MLSPFPRPITTALHAFSLSGYVSPHVNRNGTFCFFCVEFAEVTNVTFPPIYETFLSVIGVFSLDLGWILSATCLASEVDFYDKLL